MGQSYYSLNTSNDGPSSEERQNWDPWHVGEEANVMSAKAVDASL